MRQRGQPEVIRQGISVEEGSLPGRGILGSRGLWGCTAGAEAEVGLGTVHPKEGQGAELEGVLGANT